MQNLKLQSAMEYLMTYGWAILIIAIVMVALFSLGILGGSPLSTTCLPHSGFQCSGVTYNHGTIGTPVLVPGNVILTIGQTTGTNWAVANIFFVPTGTGLSAAGLPTSITTTGLVVAATGGEGTANILATGLNSGQTTQVTLGVPGATTVSVGSSASGTVWAQYWTTTAGPYYTQMATINLKAA